MSNEQSPFMKKSEVSRLHPVTDDARWHAETVGMFPRRVQLSAKIAGWRRSEVNDWFSDPAGWAQRHRGASAA
jgi:predicted DNA-binding transcriptional regulator AlpA